MYYKNGISIVKTAPPQGAGPAHRVALVFQCTPSCQYYTFDRSGPVEDVMTTTFRCKRENREISKVENYEGDKTEYPHTPHWCAFSGFAYKDAVSSINNLLDDVERMSMIAIKLSKPLTLDSQNPNYRKACFNFFYPINGVAKLATGHVHVHHRHIVNDNRLLVQFVEYHKTERNALIEFPEEIMPGMSRRAWVRKDDLINAPPLP